MDREPRESLVSDGAAATTNQSDERSLPDEISSSQTRWSTKGQNATKIFPARDPITPLYAPTASNTISDEGTSDEGNGEESREAKTGDLVPTTFEWLQEAHEVYITGTIFDWNKKRRLYPVEGRPRIFGSIISVGPGTHHLRFIVDGVEKCSPDLPTTVDSGNNLVNYIEVRLDDLFIDHQEASTSLDINGPEQRTSEISKLTVSASQPFFNSIFQRSSSTAITGSSTPVLEKGDTETRYVDSVYSVDDERTSLISLLNHNTGYLGFASDLADDFVTVYPTAGSLSTNSSVSSIHHSVIELVVGKFVNDKELSLLYEEATKRLTNDRFVRNQRRLLKQLFLDLRSQVTTPIESQAIRILRGRKERIRIAEHIWAIVNPANPSKHAQMAALLKQKVDKHQQLDRLLSDGGPSNDNKVEGNEQNALNGELNNSDFGDTDFEGYPNVSLATDFLLGGIPFKQYKLSLRRSLRLDAFPKLHDLIAAGDILAVARLLSGHFQDVAKDEFEWLHELQEIGCNFEEMAKLLIDGENGSPWVATERFATHKKSIRSNRLGPTLRFEL